MDILSEELIVNVWGLRYEKCLLGNRVNLKEDIILVSSTTIELIRLP